MRLTFLEYSEYKGLPDEWIAKPIEFGPINLIVGKNSSGKSRILNVIGAFGALLAGKRRIALSGAFEGHFVEDTRRKPKHLIYELRHEDSHVVFERFTVDGDVLLERKKDGRGVIRAIQLKKDIEFEAPGNALAAVVRRDRIQHPFFEGLHEWGSMLKHYLFGSDFGKTNLAIFGEKSKESVSRPEAFEQTQVVSLYRRYRRELGSKLDRAILADMQTMGYPCQEIGLMTVQGVQGVQMSVWQLYLKEKDLKCRTSQLNMSQGMFRALALTMQLNASALSKSADCVLIDDVSEGLDFDRASRLISLLVSKAEKGNFQLIMTTNDRFVMNSVPLKYWSLLTRKKSVVHILNEKNSPKFFKDFQYTGLSNFDFFKSLPSSR